MEQNLEIKYKGLFIIGVGGLGYVLATCVAPVVGGRIPYIICDGDTFEGGAGVTRFPNIYAKSQNKVEYVARWIEYTWGDKAPDTMPVPLEPDHITGVHKGWLFVDCTDAKVKDRRAWRDKIEEVGGTYMRASYDFFGCDVALGPPISINDDAAGYREPVHRWHALGAGGFAAQFVIDALFSGVPKEGEYRAPTYKIEVPKEVSEDGHSETVSEDLSGGDGDSGPGEDPGERPSRTSRGSKGGERQGGVRRAATGRARGQKVSKAKSK